MVGYLVILRLPDISNSLPIFLTDILSSNLLIPGVFAVLLVILLLSYKLSLAFYKKREF